METKFYSEPVYKKKILKIKIKFDGDESKHKII